MVNRTLEKVLGDWFNLKVNLFLRVDDYRVCVVCIVPCVKGIDNRYIEYLGILIIPTKPFTLATQEDTSKEVEKYLSKKYYIRKWNSLLCGSQVGVRVASDYLSVYV
jgi:hypothetical protein